MSRDESDQDRADREHLDRIEQLWEIILTADRHSAEYKCALSAISAAVTAYIENERTTPKPEP